MKARHASRLHRRLRRRAQYNLTEWQGGANLLQVIRHVQAGSAIAASLAFALVSVNSH